MSSRISVIMLTYNRQNLVGNAIESILGQTFKDFEYIIVDNGSEDCSGDIAEKYAQTDFRIRVIHIPKSSISMGRNAGLAAAKGDYVTFIDDDDTAEPKMLEFLYEAAECNRADISICGTNLKSMETVLVFNTTEAMISLLERKYYNVGFPAKLIKRDLFRNHQFPDKGKFDDIYLMPKIIAEAKKIVYAGNPYYIVNRHENNNSAWTTNHSLLTREILKEYLDVYEDRTKWLIEKYPEKENEWKYFEWSFMISMVEKIHRFQVKECEELLKNMVAKLQSCGEEFLQSKRILDFEKEWMYQYVYIR